MGFSEIVLVSNGYRSGRIDGLPNELANMLLAFRIRGLLKGGM